MPAGPALDPSPSTGRDAAGRRAVHEFHAVVWVCGIGFGLTAPFTALLVLNLGGTPTEAAITVASMGASLLLVDLSCSKVIPRLGGRWVLSGSSLVFGLGSILSAVSPSWEGVLAARMMQGLGAALFMGGGVHLAVRLSPGRAQAAAIGSFNAAWFAGIAVGPLGGGLLGTLLPGTDGLRLVFVICAGITLVAAVLGWVVSAPSTDVSRLRPGLPRGLGIRGPRAWSALGLASIGQAVRVGVAMTLVPLIGASADMSWGTVGVALFALAVTDVTAMQWGSRWVERHGRRPLLVGALVWGAALTACLGIWPPDALGLVAAGLGLGVTVGVTWTIPAAMVVDLLPDAESAVSAYRIASDLGMIGGGLLIAAALTLGGLRPTLVYASGVLMLATVITLLVGETRRVGTNQPEPIQGGKIHALPID